MRDIIFEKTKGRGRAENNACLCRSNLPMGSLKKVL